MKSKYLKGRILKAAASILLCLMMIFGTFMPMSQVSYAANGDEVRTDVTLGPGGSAKVKSINVGANAVKINAEGWRKSNGQYIYYGTYGGSPIKFRVLDMHNGYSNTIFNNGVPTMQTEYEGNYLLLDCDSTLFQAAFSSANRKEYPYSEIHDYLSAGKDNNDNSLFSDLEMGAVANTTLIASSESYSVGIDYEMSTKSLCDYDSENNKMFLLSGVEAIQAYNGNETRIKNHSYWLRSAIDGNSSMYNSTYVESSGRFLGTQANNNSRIYVSPAFNLDLASVLFTSIDGAPKDGALTKVERSDKREFKVTLKGVDKVIQTTGAVTRSGQEVSVPYAYDGDDVDQVSIVLTSGDITASDTTVLYYGKLAGATSSKSGTATFTLPAELPADYKAYILAEDINADMNTDYASEPVEIAIPEPGPEPPVTLEEFYVTFKSNGGPSVPKQTVKSGEQVIEPDPDGMTKEGYVFNGWFSDKKCKNRYYFNTSVDDDMTLYAGWVAEAEVSTIKDYKNTSDLSDDDKKDLYERNKQAAAGSNDDSFAYKSAEWTDKANGKAKITISAKDKATQADVKEVVYGMLTCSAHGFTRELAVSNIKFLVENYGCVDVIIALGPNKKDCVIIEDIMTTDKREIESILDENSFSGTIANTHYNTALYLGLCKYLNDTSHDPYAVYVSFDSDHSDTFTAAPSTSNDCWDKLKGYKTEGRYFSMGEESLNTISQVTSYNAKDAIKAGLANPSVFVSMSSMTTSGDARCDNSYKQEFSTMSPVPIASAIKFTDTIDSRFEIDGTVTSNVPGALINVNGQNVDAGFSNLDQAKAAELYIPVKLKNGASAPNGWIDTNSGNAKVTFGDSSNKSISSPKLYYDKTLDPTKKYSVTTEVVNGTIDPEGVTWAYVGTNLTVSYAPKEAAEGEEPYTLRSITVDGEPVDISQYPNSYTFKDITEPGNHTIKVVYSNKSTHNLTITKSISDTSYVTPNREFFLLVTIKDDDGNAPSKKAYKVEFASSVSNLPDTPTNTNELHLANTDDGTSTTDANLKTTARTTIAPNSDEACLRIYGIEDGMNVTIKEVNSTNKFTDSFDKPTIKVDGVEDNSVVETSHNGGGYQASTIKLDGDKTVEITNNPKEITPTGVGSASNILLYIIIGMGMVGAALYLLRRKFN